MNYSPFLNDIGFFKSHSISEHGLLKSKQQVSKEALKELKRRLLNYLSDRFEKSVLIELNEYTLIKGKSYPVGTVRNWKNAKYKKVAANKWLRMYEGESRGQRQALSLLKGRIMRAASISELAQLVRENRKRFIDADGKYAPIAAQIMSVARVSMDMPESVSAEERDVPVENDERAVKLRQWFGKSKVVNSKGDPQETYNFTPVKVYHGTPYGGFRKFAKENIGRYNLYGEGFYFTEDEEIAKNYTEKDNDDKGLMFLRAAEYLDKNGKPIKIIPERVVNSLIEHARSNNNPNWDTRIIYALERQRNADGSVDFNKLVPGVQHGVNGKTYDSFHTEIEMNRGYDRTMSADTLKMAANRLIAYFAAADYPITLKEPPAQVYELYLKIENPLDLTREATEADIQQVKDLLQKEFPNQQSFYLDDIGEVEQRKRAGFKDDYELPFTAANLDMMKRIKAELYDQRVAYEKSPRHGKIMWSIFRLSPKDKITLEEVLYILSNDKVDRMVNGYARASGHDGIKHTGGWNFTSTDAENMHKHPVWIAFEPTQIKSIDATEFDSQSDDIFKSRR